MDLIPINQDVIQRKFHKISFFNNVYDMLFGILHAALGSYKYYKPIRQYKIYLEKIVDSHRDLLVAWIEWRKFKTDKIDEALGVLSDDDLRKKISYLEIVKTELEQKLTAAKETKLPRNDELETYYNETKKRYSNWYSALGRPSFVEIFDFKKLFSVSNTSSDANKTNRMLFSLFFKTSPWIIMPLEAFFAYPAFQFITSKQIEFAIPASIMYVMILYGMGICFGMAMIRSRISKVEEISIQSNPEQKKFAIKSKINVYYSTIACLPLLAACIIVITGASLRAMVYDINHYNSIGSTLLQSREKLDENLSRVKRLQLDDKIESIKNEIKEVESSIKENEANLNNLRLITFFPAQTDWWVSFGMYIGLFLLSLISYLVKLDSYYEYGLIACELYYLDCERAERERIKYDKIEHVKTELEKTNTNLNQLVGEKNSRDTSGENKDTKENDATVIYEKIVTSFDSAAEAWKIKRLGTFSRWFLAFAGKRIQDREQFNDIPQ